MVFTNESWPAPHPQNPLQAELKIPGSKSLSNRYLILAALGFHPVDIRGLLRSRDTDLMIDALQVFGVNCEFTSENRTQVIIEPPSNGVFAGGGKVNCGLAGTVMRFAPALAMLADGPTYFYGDEQAQKRPMQPLLDALEHLGATISYQGEIGKLPFTIVPPQRFMGGEVTLDSSASSQFVSGLLMLGSRARSGLVIRHRGIAVPSMPHVRMTVSDLQLAGIKVEANENEFVWRVQTPDCLFGPKLPDIVHVEPDLSNAAPFLSAALIAGGSVLVKNWPSTTTQPGGLLPQILTEMGATVSFPEVHGAQACQVTGHGVIHGLGEFNMAAAGELAPTIAAISMFADSDTSLKGIAHLRGHETNRLMALVSEIKRVGGQAEELSDGISIHPVPYQQLHSTCIESYNDHRMATFGALLGLKIPGIRVKNIQTTAKTLPDFVNLWQTMLC